MIYVYIYNWSYTNSDCWPNGFVWELGECHSSEPKIFRIEPTLWGTFFTTFSDKPTFITSRWFYILKTSPSLPRHIVILGPFLTHCQTHQKTVPCCNLTLCYGRSPLFRGKSSYINHLKRTVPTPCWLIGYYPLKKHEHYGMFLVPYWIYI
jgi:hypothetical protein